MNNDISMSRLNILNLVALGEIPEEDVVLTDEEKEIVEEKREIMEEFENDGEEVVWSTPDD